MTFEKLPSFKKSTKCEELLKKIQVLQNIDVVLNVRLDVRTRWNSTYHMITRMTKMMSSIVQYESFYKMLSTYHNQNC